MTDRRRGLAVVLAGLFVAAACTSTATPAPATPATATPATATVTPAPSSPPTTMPVPTAAPTATSSPAGGATGLDVPIGDPSRADQEYVWISAVSSFPLFVERVYPGLEAAKKALNVKVRIAGPPSTIDLAAFRAAVDTECTAGPAGVIIVGGWDDSLAAEVDTCIEKKVPTIVTDGDLPMSRRLAFVGTDWYRLGRAHGSYQCKYHKERALASGKIGTISFSLTNRNSSQAPQGLRDQLKEECPTVEVVADEESPDNYEQAAAKTAAILSAHPDLTGMVGFGYDSPGIVRAVSEAGKVGQIIITSFEGGREFLQTIKDGSVSMISFEKYETMDFFAVLMLYAFHNDIIRNLNLDPWLQNPLPPLVDSGLIIVTKDNVDAVLESTKPAQ